MERVTVLPDSDSSANSVRLDAWVLPFLNLYGFYGRTKSETVTSVTIEDPRPGDRPPITFDVPTSLSGNTWGGGGVLAGGYQGWFGTLNLNYSVTDLGIDSEITANVNSIRAGRHFEGTDFSGALWLGGTYWNVEKTANGSVEVDGLGALEFAVDYGPIEPFNMVVGGRLLAYEHLELVFDYGFWDDVAVLTGQATLRF